MSHAAGSRQMVHKLVRVWLEAPEQVWVLKAVTLWQLREKFPFSSYTLPNSPFAFQSCPCQILTHPQLCKWRLGSKLNSGAWCTATLTPIFVSSPIVIKYDWILENIRQKKQPSHFPFSVFTYVCMYVTSLEDGHRAVHLPVISTVGVWQIQDKRSMTEPIFSNLWTWLHCSCLTDLATGT